MATKSPTHSSARLPRSARATRPRGYVLLESMVSVLVISIGFIGFAGAQLRAMSSANGSLLRSKAVELAYQMTDRTRANSQAALAGAYNAFTGAVVDPGCATAGCTGAQMAQADFAEWRAQVAAALPAGSGVVCLDSTPDDGDAANAQCDNLGTTLVVKIFWTEKSGTYRFANAFRP